MHIVFQEKKCAFIIIISTISESQMKCQAPADSSSSSLPILMYELSVGELEENSMDYESSHYHTCIPLRTTSLPAVVEDGTSLI